MKPLNPEIKLQNSGGIFDLIDNVVKGGINITDEQYDFICEEATDEELDKFSSILFSNEGATFAEKRQALQVKNKYINLFNSK